MNCFVRLFVALIFAILSNFSSPTASAQSGTLTPGMLFKGEMKGPQKSSNFIGVDYADELPIKLKGGESFSVTARVVGTGRCIIVGLVDPTGRRIASKVGENQNCQLDVKELSASGTYTLVVSSDRIGLYTVLVAGSSDEASTIKALETRIEQARRDLAKLEEELKVLKEKSRKR